MATDDVLREIQESLRRLERKVENLEDPPLVSGRQGSRPTEQFSKIELEIRKAIEAHMKDCAVALKERLIEKLDPITKRIEKMEVRVEEIKKDLGMKINGVKEDANKTATGSVIPISEKVEMLGRDVVAIKKTLVGQDNEPGLEDMVRELGGWIEKEESDREVAREASRFNLTTWLTVIGIVVAIGVGVAGIIW